MNRRLVLLAAALVALAGSPTGAAAQLAAAPEVGWSENRRGTVGARVLWQFPFHLRVVGQGLYFFPDESGVAEPGVGVDRKSWQLNANVLYDFDRRRVYAYAGAGVSWGRGSLTLNVDGLEASAVSSDWAANLIFGLRLPSDGFVPFVEGKSELWRGGQWVITSGLALPLR